MSNFYTQFRAMGCQVQIWLSVPAPEYAERLWEVAEWFEGWEQTFSRFRPNSELCGLNRQAGAWVGVSDELFDVVADAVDAVQLTRGTFNPLILDALEAAGYGHSFDPANFVPDDDTLERVVPDASLIEIDTHRHALRLPQHSRIDLGGIAKGWAIDRTVERLAQSGPCLVNVGGDMAASGSPDQSAGWEVTVTHPQTEETLATLTLQNNAVATSGTDFRRWERAAMPHRILHHLIDPRTGEPAARGVLAATVVAPDAETATIWSKCALIDARLPKLPALLIQDDGSIRQNASFGQLCHSLGRTQS